MNKVVTSSTRGFKMNGTATQLREVDVFPNGDVHVSFEPNKPGTLLDSHGAMVESQKQGFMVKIDAKAAETIELRKGTIWVIGLAPAFLTLMIGGAVLLIGYGRADQSQVEKQIQMGADIQRMVEGQKRMEEQFQKLDGRLQEQEKLNERVKGYQLGQTDAGATGHKKNK